MLRLPQTKHVRNKELPKKMVTRSKHILSFSLSVPEISRVISFDLVTFNLLWSQRHLVYCSHLVNCIHLVYCSGVSQDFLNSELSFSWTRCHPRLFTHIWSGAGRRDGLKLSTRYLYVNERNVLDLALQFVNPSHCPLCYFLILSLSVIDVAIFFETYSLQTYHLHCILTIFLQNYRPVA